MDWKRIGLIAGFIAITIGLIWGIYLLFFAPIAPLPAPAPTPAEPSGQLPTPGAFIPPTPVTEVPTQLPTTKTLPQTAKEAAGGPVQTTEMSTDRNQVAQLASDGKSVVTYDKFDCKFYKITADKQVQPMTDQTFCGSDTVTLAPGSNRAIISFLDGSNIFYDFTTKRQVTLPKHWQDFNFSPSGQEIAFKSLGDDPDNRWMAIANADGSNGKQIEDLGQKAGLFDVNWSPTNQIIGTFHEGIDGERQNLFFIGKNGENFKSTTVEGRDIRSVWSTNGDRLLYSAYSSNSNYNPALWIVDASGDNIGNNRTNLGIATWANKCTFADNTTLYCAVPRTLAQGAGLLPNSFDKGPDDLYRISLTNGSKVKLAETDGPHAIEKIVVSTDQKTMYFTDKASGRLYKIALQ